MLTLLQMMDHALSQAQLDSTFRSDARLWYNIIVNKLTSYSDYPFYRTSQLLPMVSGQSRYSLPADFNNADEAYATDANGNTSQPIPLIESYLFQQMAIGNVSGSATVGHIDTQSLELVLNSVPNSPSNQVKLFYFRKPAQVDLAGADDGTTPDFLDQTLIMEELKAMAYEFRNDDRYAQKKQEAKAAGVEFQRNMYQDDSYSTIPLNSVNFRGGRGRGRSRGFKA